MKPLTSAPKGTQDTLPSDITRWHYVERAALDIAERYGFFEMRTPTFEHTELFNRAVGDTTDVVQKEMYTFNDKKDRSITLRPEGTAGVVRAAIEHNLLGGQLPVKASYVISCFRYEKPQAGRLREFHQFGIESLGSPSPAADAECIALGNQVLETLGVDKIKLFINSIGCKQCRPAYQAKLKAYFSGYTDQLCETCLTRLETNPLRIIDCKSPICKEIAAKAPKMMDHLCSECEDHFAELRERLEAMGIRYEIDPDIVRGLDYYCRTVFEFVTEAIGAQGTVCGGGRYDGLIEELGGPSMPGVGFAMGLERLQLVMAASGAQVPAPLLCELFIAPMGKTASIAAGTLVQKLRAEGVSADCETMSRSLKAQMRYADKLGAIYTMVLGDNELAAGRATVKEMSTGAASEITLGEDFADEFVKLSVQRHISDVADAATKL
ncbi:MAG TPA: histidine--tRNA ligase [Clostridia bacterium]|nr:histidine--tRNA ligase [Clostridia bacterium]